MSVPSGWLDLQTVSAIRLMGEQLAHWAEGLSADERQRQLDAMVAWTEHVHAFINSFAGVVSEKSVARANELVDYGEAPEGLRQLAWAIVSEGASVSAAQAVQIADWTDGFMPLEDLPAEMMAKILECRLLGSSE